MVYVGSDFSGVGAFNQALIRLNIDYHEVFACDQDKYARQTFLHNYGCPQDFPENVYDREIPAYPLDIYMSSPPCQSFSVAGKRLGKNEQRGILFFNSHEFIVKNKPRYFIFENVKGLLSDDNGKTFKEWVNMLGGKSVNGLPILWPYENSVPYHLYWKVINAKDHNILQNRERVFIVGIRDDQDNFFRWPKNEYLTTTLHDLLETNIDDKYYLTPQMIQQIEDNKTDKVKTKKSDYFNKQTWIADYRNDEGLRIRKDDVSPCMTHRRHSENDISTMPPLVGERFDMKFRNKQLDETVKKNQHKLIDNDPKVLDLYNRSIHPYSPCLTDPKHCNTMLFDGYKIRKLTPRECFRIMDFPDSFTWECSDIQAYKQAGNSIVVKCLELIIKNFKL